MSVATLNLICPKCRHVYESAHRVPLCPACDHRPRIAVDLSPFDQHESPWKYIVGLLALGGTIAALFGLGII